MRKKLWQHAEQMSLYNFILRKKETPAQLLSCGICETFKNSGGCLWKHVTYYYIMKSYIGHKLAAFNAVLLLLLLLLLYLLLCLWWDMRLEHDVVWLERSERTAETCAWNKQKHCSCCIMLTRLIPFYQRISRIIF